MDRESMKDLGMVLSSHALAYLIKHHPIGEGYRSFRIRSEPIGFVQSPHLWGSIQPSLGYAANLVKVPRGYDGPLDRARVRDNLAARVLFEPPDERDVVVCEAAAIDRHLLTYDLLRDKVAAAAREHGIRLGWKPQLL